MYKKKMWHPTFRYIYTIVSCNIQITYYVIASMQPTLT